MYKAFETFGSNRFTATNIDIYRNYVHGRLMVAAIAPGLIKIFKSYPNNKNYEFTDGYNLNT